MYVLGKEDSFFVMRKKQVGRTLEVLLCRAIEPGKIRKHAISFVNAFNAIVMSFIIGLPDFSVYRNRVINGRPQFQAALE